MNNDLISRERLKNTILLGNYDTRSKILSAIDNAPTIEIPNYGGQVVPDTLQGWRYEERPQGELIELTDEVWKLYKKHQSHLATYVLEFGEELAGLLGKYNEGGAE